MRTIVIHKCSNLLAYHILSLANNSHIGTSKTYFTPHVVKEVVGK